MMPSVWQIPRLRVCFLFCLTEPLAMWPAVRNDALLTRHFFRCLTGLHEKWAVLGRLAWQNRDGWPRHPATHMNSFVHKNWRRDFYNEAFNWSEPIKQFLGSACPALETQIKSVDSSVAIERYLDD